MARKRTRPLAGVSGEVCTKKGKKLWKEIKKDLTEPALLEMDGYGVYSGAGEKIGKKLFFIPTGRRKKCL